jgi:hypothetical protein
VLVMLTKPLISLFNLVKCAVVERVHRPIREKLYKYFTHKNAFRYIYVLQKFVSAYNDTVHSTTGVAATKVNDSNILEIWKRIIY